MPRRAVLQVNKRAATEAASLLHCSSRGLRQAHMLHRCRNNINNSSSSSNHLHHRATISKDPHLHTRMMCARQTHRCLRLRWPCTRRNNNSLAASIPSLLSHNSSSSNTAHRRHIRSSLPASKPTRTTRILCRPRLQVFTAARIPIHLSIRSLVLLLVHLCSHTPANLRSSRLIINAQHLVLPMPCSTRSTCPRSHLLLLCRRNLHTLPSRRKPMLRDHPSTTLQMCRSATEASALVPRQKSYSRHAKIAPIRHGP